MGQEEKVKLGMYGELPKVKIGQFTISMTSNEKNEDSVWIEKEDGEGGEFPCESLEEIISAFFDANF